MSKIESFHPKPVESASAAAALSIQKVAYAEAPVRGQSVNELPPEFPSYSIEHKQLQDGGQSTMISTGLASNEVYIEGEDEPACAFYAHPIPSLELPAGLAAAEMELKEGKGSTADQIGLGAQLGVVKGVYALGNGFIEMGNMAISPEMRFGNFLANTIKNPDLAMKDAENWGVEIAPAVHNVLVADKYLEDVSKAELKGDFGKVPRDLMGAAQKLGDQFNQKNVGEKTEFVTEQATVWITPLAAAKAAHGLTVAEQLEASSMANKAERSEQSLSGIKHSDVLDHEQPAGFEKAPPMSPHFEAMLQRGLEDVKQRLSAAELDAVKNITIEGFSSIAEVRGEAFKSTLAVFDRSGKIGVKINLADTSAEFEELLGPKVEVGEYVKKTTGWIENQKLQSTIAHELGHAINVMMEDSKDLRIMSERSAFSRTFEGDFQAIQGSKAARTQFRKLFDRPRFYTDGTNQINMVKVRDEVFAELFAEAKGYPPCSDYAELLRTQFRKTAAFMRGAHGYNHQI